MTDGFNVMVTESLVTPGAAPTLTGSIADQELTQGTAYTSATAFPAATGGDGTITYSVASLPGGITLNSDRKLTGTATGPLAKTQLTYKATDSDATDPDSATTLKFTISVAPKKPANFTATAGDRSAVLAWTALAGVSGWQVSTDDATTWTAIAGSDAGTDQHTVGGLTSGAAYRISVRAVVGSGDTLVEGMASNQVSVTPSTPTADEESPLARSANVLNPVVLPDVARAIADRAVEAIAVRVEQERAAPATATGLIDRGGRSVHVDSLWGGFDYGRLVGGGVATPREVTWDGALTTVPLGADVQLGEQVLVGLAAVLSQTRLDYEHGEHTGEYHIDLIGLHPYLGWTPGAVSVWATLGTAVGTLRVTGTAEPGKERTGDLWMGSAGAGVSATVWEREATRARLEAQAFGAHLVLSAGEGGMKPARAEVARLRAAVGVDSGFQLATGGRLEPGVELGTYYDLGDGNGGFGLEAGGGVRYRHASLTLASRARVLLGTDFAVKNWGVGGTVRWAFGDGGEGLLVSVSPSYGQTERDVGSLWSEGLPVAGEAVDAGGARLTGHAGYGLALESGVLTPYGEFSLSEGASGTLRQYRLGLRHELSTGLELEVIGVRDERQDSAEHTFMVQGRIAP